jgi:hypothetical protein
MDAKYSFYLFFAFLLLVTGQVEAQVTRDRISRGDQYERYERYERFGRITTPAARFGFVTSQVSNNGEKLKDSNFNSFYFGVFGERDLGYFLYSSTGLDYYEIGSRTDEYNNLKMGYLGVPLSIGARIGPAKVFIGTCPSIRLFASELEDGRKVSFERGKYKLLDSSLFFGAGVRFLFLGAEIRYYHGLAEVLDNYNSRYFQIGGNLYF